MEWEERKRRGKRKRITDREQTKGGRGGRERRAQIHFTHAVTYISTSTPIIPLH